MNKRLKYYDICIAYVLLQHLYAHVAFIILTGYFKQFYTGRGYEILYIF